MLRNQNKQKIGLGSTIVLQLHRYSQDLPYSASNFVETCVESDEPANIFFVAGDRVVFAAPTFINIYTISLYQDSSPSKLVLLHRFPISQAPHLLSDPFIGSHGTYLVGIYKDAFRRITIKHDHNIPPIVEELGNLEPLSRELETFDVRFEPSASLVWSERFLDIIMYENWVDGAYFRRKQYDTSDYEVSVRCLVAFDDSIGRIVVDTDTSQGQLMVLDLL